MSELVVPQSNSQQKRGILYTVAFVVALMALFLGLFLHKMLSPRILSDQELAANGAVAFAKPRVIQPFHLLDETGKPFTVEHLKGHWTLMFFGFASCPDICPTTLATLSRLTKTLEPDILANTQVVMVTVDPARDTPEVLEPYIHFFNEDFNALTGEFLEIKRLADNLNVAFNKVVQGDSYSVDHSANIVLINPYGHYAGFLRPPFELARLKLTYQSIVSRFPD